MSIKIVSKTQANQYARRSTIKAVKDTRLNLAAKPPINSPTTLI